nr:nucleolar RNA-binding Nop10p family protein [Candidatus Sigynarchaeum springense]MDO8117424.1 nucleolar RNA-binding Nop10p family protein [Candidatus Sigynarchaeota archaeon]
MPKSLSKCLKCGAYTMKSGSCPSCGSPNLRLAYPPKFSVDDKFGKYRREMKRQLWLKQQGQK